MNAFLRSIIEFYFFKKKFFKHVIMESLRLEEENTLKDITNLFRLKKEQNYTS